MKSITRIFRLIQINFILARYGLDQIILSLHLFRPLRFISYFNPWNWRANRNNTRAVRIRLALEALGPIFVKFGQALSTRPDFIPQDIVEELSKLQDKVPPFPGETAQVMIEAAIGQPLHEIFLEFDLTPLASASIAQVHAATLHNGKSVVVKVLRPNVLKLIKRDVDLLYTLANFAKRFWPDARRLRPREVVAEFEQHLIDELDLLREAANASQLRRNFLYSSLLYIPEVHWAYSRETVLVQERIDGIPISDIAELKRNGVDLKKLSERGVEIFFTQVFRDCFFHADMHPGNIFVARNKPPEDPQYLGVDFGIMGTLSPYDQRYLAENLLAFFNRDYRRVAELHVESGWVPSDTPINDFESAIRTVCEPIFERPLKEISFGQLLLRLFQTARRFNMEVQPQLMLLQKTLFNVEGLGRQLYPDLDLWNTAKPYLEKWLKQQMGVRALFKKVREQMPYWLEKSPDIPELVYQVLTETRNQTREKQLTNIEKKQQQLYLQMRRQHKLQFNVGMVLLLWAVLGIVGGQNWLQMLNHPLFNWMLGLFGLFLLLLSRV